MSVLVHRHAPLLVGALALVLLAGVILLRFPLPAGLAEGHSAVDELSRLGGCVRCHAEGGLDGGCLACHDEIGAQLARGEGYHAHLAETADGERCTTCHLEHFGARFEVAGEFAWRELGRDSFDHPHIEYSLEGAHDELACESCHAAEYVPDVHTAEFPHILRAQTFLGLGQECRGCHEDIHAGGLSPECTECHDQSAFRPASGFDHDEHFPLGCAHERVECHLCHLIPAASAPAEVRSLPFADVRGTECLECHESPHQSEFSVDCFDCHPKEACRWREGQEAMTAALHAETGFPLARPHAEVSCDGCHPELLLDYAARFPDPAAPGYLRAPETCQGCHEDEHRGQFAGRYAQCRDCHSPHGFVPAEFTIADHAVWPLDGAHRAVACNDCHPIPEGSEHRAYVGVGTECVSCHRDPHLAQFAESPGGMECTRCHTTREDWSAPAFDHDRDSRFPLDGDHRDVPCASCHPESVRPDGHTYVHYRPLGRECQDCHERPMR